MNDQYPTCESRAEAISLLAAGCLTPEDEYDLRQHLAICTVCREQSEQITFVCSGLRKAKHFAATFNVSALVSRTMVELPVSIKPTVTANFPGSSRSRSSLWCRLAMSAVLAGSLLVGIFWWSFSGGTTHESETARQESSPRGREQDLRQVITDATIAASGPPTWLALRRASDQSDEAFETLLAQDSGALLTEPKNRRTLFQEYLQ